ncbi:MAG: hypothetical protein E6K56_08400, partial [Ignavibacteria bacterium]
IFSDSGDTATAQAWFKGIEHIDQTEHVEPLWIPYIFSGMPIFGALIFPREVNYIQQYVVLPIAKVLFFGVDMAWMIIPFLVIGASMYLLARQLAFTPIPSLLAAITFMLNPYAVGLPETGHGSKLIVLSYIPLLFLLTYNLFQRRDLLTIGLLAAAVGTMLLARHPQMAFYGLLVIDSYFGYEIILDLREAPLTGLRNAGLFVLALAIGFAIYAYQYLPTQEYSQYSIRGGEAGAGGLSYDYATSWSFHPFELMNYLIPSFFGLADQMYWGWMPFTNSTLYIGIAPLFLGIMAVIHRRNRITWFLALLSAVLFLLSFGKHFGLLYDVMFRYFPLFNKFRVPVMILHLIPFTFGLLAAYGFSFVSEMPQQGKEPELMKMQKRLRNIITVIGVLLIVGLVFNDGLYSFLSSFMFEKEGEMTLLRSQYGVQASQAMAQLKKLRFDLFWKDYIKFAIIAGATLGLVIAYLKRKLRLTTFGFVLLAILIVDLVILDGRYINPKPNTSIVDHFQADEAIQKLQSESDTTLFRVYPLGRLDEENRMMYFWLQDVQGYSPAKLKIYQDMRDSCLNRGNRSVINMLNIKYILTEGKSKDGSPQTVVQQNPAYLPRMWFVDSTVVVRSKAEIFNLLNSAEWNPGTTAILEKELPSKFSRSGADNVTMTKYGSREIALKTTTANNALLVLSEIYYPAGWKAFIDGTETEIFKTNYILRSVLVPAGSHIVEFRFDPPIYYLGFSITQGAWGVTAILTRGPRKHPRLPSEHCAPGLRAIAGPKIRRSAAPQNSSIDGTWREFPTRRLKEKGRLSVPFGTIIFDPQCLHLFHQCTVAAADSFDPLHPFLHRRFGEIGALLHFLQNSRAFILLLETPDRPVDVLVFLQDDPDQLIHLLLFYFNK